MLSCLVDAVHRPAQKCDLLSIAESTLSIVPQVRQLGRSVTSSTARSATEELPVPDVDKNSFLKWLGLVPAQSSDFQKQSEAVECNVIVIDDDDEDDQMPRYLDSGIADLFGTTRPLRGDREINGNGTSRLLQPCSRLRKLLSIDISSPLGSRTLQCVISTLRNDGLPLNPYTVSHSLAGSDNALDYGTFCRTPVKGMFSGRLRKREFPVKYRLASAGTHYHYYCFGRADRGRFCRRFDSGLSGRSRRLRQKYNRCWVVLERLATEEISDWRSSKRLCDYVARMEEKEKAATVNSSHNIADDEVINVSSDSEDEIPTPVKKQDLMFRCHQCEIKLPCSGRFRDLIREHYRMCHGIINVDILRRPQPDGSTMMQVVHVPTTVAQRSAAESSSSSADQCSLVTCTAPTSQHSNSLYNVLPNSCQSHTGMCTVRPPMPSQVQFVRAAWPAGAGEPIATSAYTASQPPSQPLTQLQHAIPPHETMSEPVPLMPSPGKPFYRHPALLNGSVLCRGDAASTESCDADVICLD